MVIKMKKNQSVVRGQSRPFYDKKEGKKPALLFVLPILMILVLAGTIYLAYRDSVPSERETASAASSVSMVSSAVSGESS